MLWPLKIFNYHLILHMYICPLWERGTCITIKSDRLGHRRECYLWILFIIVIVSERERCRYVFVLLAPYIKELLKPSEFPQSLCYFFGGLMNQGNMGQFQMEDWSSLGKGTENASLASISKQWPRTRKRMRHFTELLNCWASSPISTEEITTRPLFFMMLPRKAASAQAAEHPDTICLVCTTVTLTTPFWMLWKTFAYPSNSQILPPISQARDPEHWCSPWHS